MLTKEMEDHKIMMWAETADISTRDDFNTMNMKTLVTKTIVVTVIKTIIWEEMVDISIIDDPRTMNTRALGINTTEMRDIQTIM